MHDFDPQKLTVTTKSPSSPHSPVSIAGAEVVAVMLNVVKTCERVTLVDASGPAVEMTAVRFPGVDMVVALSCDELGQGLVAAGIPDWPLNVVLCMAAVFVGTGTVTTTELLEPGSRNVTKSVGI